MGFKCGIVGLPNVGKSTLFNALTRAGIAAANYPFCTIEPNIGIVNVPDSRLQALAAIVNPERILPTTIEFVDIAGLVAGASKGEGLGNQFLAHIRETQVIAHVVRCFEDENIIHVAGKINPLDDIEIIHTELLLADLEAVEKRLPRLEKQAKGNDKIAIEAYEWLQKLHKHLAEGHPARTCLPAKGTLQDIQQKAGIQLITTKPMLYIANVLEEGFNHNPHLKAVEALAAKEHAHVIPVCAAIEVEIAELDEQDKLEFLKSMGQTESGLDKIIRAGYDLLGLQTYFTAGEKEVRAWTIEKGATAPQAAGVIHTDFEKGFIRAEVIAYDDYIAFNGENGAKEAGKWRLEGKDYIMHDGDVVHFRFNV